MNSIKKEEVIFCQFHPLSSFSLGPNSGSGKCVETCSWQHGHACLCLCVCVAGELGHPCQEQPVAVLAQPHSKTINVLYGESSAGSSGGRGDGCGCKATSLMD